MGRRREQGGAPRPSGLSDVTPPGIDFQKKKSGTRSQMRTFLWTPYATTTTTCTPGFDWPELSPPPRGPPLRRGGVTSLRPLGRGAPPCDPCSFLTRVPAGGLILRCCSRSARQKRPFRQSGFSVVVFGIEIKVEDGRISW